MRGRIDIPKLWVYKSMTNLYIFEDEKVQLDYTKELIRKYQERTGNLLNCHVVPVLCNYEAHVELIQKSSNTTNIYIIDVTVGEDTDGFKIAKKIRQFDYNGYIIFITSHIELLSLSLDMNLKPLAYIYKMDSDVFGKLSRALDTVAEELSMAKPLTVDESEPSYLKYVYKSQHIKVAYKDICFIETSTEKRCLNIHTENEKLEYPATIKDVLNDFPEGFIRGSRASVVNIDKMTSIAYEERVYIAMFGKAKRCQLSNKYYKGVLERFKG